jgi:hypothetical protein
MEELDCPAVSALRRAIAEVKQLWSAMGWVTIYYLELLRATFAVVVSHQTTLAPRGGLWPDLMCNLEGRPVP